MDVRQRGALTVWAMATSTLAAPTPPGQVGILVITGSPGSGGLIQHQFIVDAFEPATLVVRATLWDAGFETLVTLDGSQLPVSALGPTPTYSWRQPEGMPVNLSSASAVAPAFATGRLTDFVDLQDKFGPIDGVGLDAEQVRPSTYRFRLIVSGNPRTRTGIFTVVCASTSPQQPNTPIGVLTFFKAATNSTDRTLVSRPVGSTATLLNPTSLMPALRPDVEGTCIIRDNMTGQVRPNIGATWTGWEFCAICHGPGNNVGLKNIVTPWARTGRATFFKDMINGQCGPGSRARPR